MKYILLLCCHLLEYGSPNTWPRAQRYCQLIASSPSISSPCYFLNKISCDNSSPWSFYVQPLIQFSKLSTLMHYNLFIKKRKYRSRQDVCISRLPLSVLSGVCLFTSQCHLFFFEKYKSSFLQQVTQKVLNLGHFRHILMTQSQSHSSFLTCRRKSCLYYDRHNSCLYNPSCVGGIPDWCFP